MIQPSNETTETQAERAETTKLTPSERHGLLTAERRRLAVDILAGQTTPVKLKELAAGIAAREDGRPADEELIKRVKISLHHVHLPKMAETGVLNYDSDSHRIEPDGDRIDVVRNDHSRYW